MRLLVIGDPHGKLPRGLTNIIRRKKIELIVCLGDIPYTPKKPWLEEVWTKKVFKKATKSYRDIIDKLCSYRLPILTLRGNMFYGKYDDKDYTKITRKIFKKIKIFFIKELEK